MRHPWFNLRMLVVGSILIGVYLPIMWIVVDLGAPPEYVIGGVAFILWVQYIVGVRRAIHSVDVEKIQPDNFLYERVHPIADELDVPMPNVYVGEFGAPNAFATGRKGNGHIVLAEELFEYMEPDEIDAIIAHEMSHLRSRDTIPMVIGQGSAGIMFLGASLVESLIAPNLHNRRQPSSVHSPMGNAAHTLVMCFVFAISRQREYIADADSVAALGSPVPLQNALLKLEYIMSSGVHSQSDIPEAVEALCITSDWSFASLVASHPPLEDRVDTLSQYADQLDEE